jgi:hypothetical protein
MLKKQGNKNQVIPELIISERKEDLDYLNLFLDCADLNDLKSKSEYWMIPHSSKQLSYSTHGLFRFFGKFPAPIASHIITRFTNRNDLVFDPMIGSGTTAVEALRLSRKIVGADISPLSELLTRVKCQYIDVESLNDTLDLIKNQYNSKEMDPFDYDNFPLDKKRVLHWFLPETILSLNHLKSIISQIEQSELRDFFTVMFLSVIRKVSRATSQQGRLFLDVETAKKEAFSDFEKNAKKFIQSVSSLPKDFISPKFYLADMRQMKISENPDLVICHPPYFNLYKFSTIFTLELAWMNLNNSDFKNGEIREYFKIGKKENVHTYVKDLSEGVKNISSQLRPGAMFSIMMGDTRIHGEHVQTTKLFLNSLEGSNLELKILAVRRPQYTEASWVTSLRRESDKIGVSLSDFIITFRRV